MNWKSFFIGGAVFAVIGVLVAVPLVLWFFAELTKAFGH